MEENTALPKHGHGSVEDAGNDDTTIVCHCGGVELKLPSKPGSLNECRCSVCYCYGSLWAYYSRQDVTVSTSNGAELQKYTREGEDFGYLSFYRCSRCGCVTHWWGEGKYAAPEKKMGVNCRLMAEKKIEGIPRRVSYC